MSKHGVAWKGEVGDCVSLGEGSHDKKHNNSSGILVANIP